MQFLLPGYYLHLLSVHAVVQSSSIEMEKSRHAERWIHNKPL